MAFQGCPGSQMMDLRKNAETTDADSAAIAQSQLRQWPIQLHLIAPTAPYYQGADVVLAADCTAFSFGNFHNDYIKGKAIAIACPKLDDGQDEYVEKIRAWFDEAKINTLTVVIMQVPCCGGLLHLAKQALSQATRKVPLKAIVLSLQGEILSEEWVTV
ncbi:MAG: 4Fe-4S ferredoxin [Fibrobacter sp.]|jgi:hypothetical protein|nr:4Fe-4S ferredoxin [Fibrobacter sp.]